MPTVKNKRKLCETSLSDFSIEQIDGVPFYSRYPEMERLFRKLVPTVDFGRCFAQPYENNAKRVVEWFFVPGENAPSRLTDLSNLDAEAYNNSIAERDAIIRAISSAMETVGENERKFLKVALSGIQSPEADSTTFFHDGQIVFGAWGMRAKPGRNLEDVIREDVLDHRVFSINYEVVGEGGLSFSSIARKYGHKLSPSDVPQVTPADGWSFVRWEPDIPQGWTVVGDSTFVAVCENTIIQLENNDPHISGKPDDNVPDNEEDKKHVQFRCEHGGSLQGITDYWKNKGDIIASAEVPSAIPDDEYEFVGWDQEPEDYEVHSDVVFTAKFRELDKKQYKVHFNDGGHGKLQGQTEYDKFYEEQVSDEEIPEVKPNEGYRFVGWDKNPKEHVVKEDVEFTARYEEKDDSWWGRFWGWGSGCLNWLLTLLLLALIGLLLWYLLGKHNLNFCGCDCNCNEVVVVPDSSIVPKPYPVEIDTIREDEVLPEPTENCGVHFSGWYLSDRDEYPWRDCSKIFEEDEYGEYVGQGYYPDNTKILPKSMRNTFDAVAVRKGTHLIIYSEPNFKGRKVLDVTGPMLIENVYAQRSYGKLMRYTFSGELQEMFPPERRQWSSENMHSWANGSCKIICEECE